VASGMVPPVGDILFLFAGFPLSHVDGGIVPYEVVVDFLTLNDSTH